MWGIFRRQLIRINFGIAFKNDIVDYRLETLGRSESRAMQPLSRVNLTGITTSFTCVKPVKSTPVVS